MLSSVCRGFDAFRNGIESASLQAIADHWAQVRGGRAMPAWTDLRPSAIAPHLTRIWSYRYDRETSEFTARLAGNQVMVAFGKNFRGVSLRDLHPPHVYEQAHARMMHLVQGPHLGRCKGPLFRKGGRVIHGERIVMPLASDGIHCDGALGASDYPLPPPSDEDQPVEIIMENEEWFALTGEERAAVLSC